MDNEIELQMQSDDFDAVHNMVPDILEDILSRAEGYLESDIVCFSAHLISLFCIFKRTVDAFQFYSDEEDIISDRYESAINRTTAAIEAELGPDYSYLGILEKLRWERLSPRSPKLN